MNETVAEVVPVEVALPIVGAPGATEPVVIEREEAEGNELPIAFFAMTVNV